MLNTETTNRSKRSGRTIDQEIGSAVRDLRKARGMSQEKLGDNIHVTFQQVQKYEKGTNRIAVSTLIDICRALDASPIDILAGVIDEDVKTDIADVIEENRLLKEQLASVRRLVS